jgi:lysophospholipid acyltransferase
MFRNYVVAAFLLLNFKDCITAWHRMSWYGHITIVLALGFFRLGGQSLLKSKLPPKVATPPAKPPRKTTASPPPEPADEDMTWVKHAFEESNRGIGRGEGAGVGLDGGLVQRTVMESGRTSRADSPI